ncbi:metallophosphoesterase [Pseudomonas sp. R2.Fl]|nr:metallophosphoesterase [Pseudomonas sp. R2.Fl]
MNADFEFLAHLGRLVQLAIRSQCALWDGAVTLSTNEEISRLRLVEELLGRSAWFEELPDPARHYWKENIDPLTKILDVPLESAHNALKHAAHVRLAHLVDREDAAAHAAAPTSRRTQLVAIASDVHLGTSASQRESFFEWLKQRKSGEEVVLLGDILDFWIYGKRDTDSILLRRIQIEWVSLWNELNRLKNAGVRFHYVPGNHDAFVWFIEAAPYLKWGPPLMEKTPLFRTLREMTSQCRLSHVASIHYPYLEISVAERAILLTHGHFDTAWDWISHISETGSGCRVAMTTITTSLAHKHSRKLRRLVNEVEWLRRTHGIEDVSIAITNSIIKTYQDIAARFEFEPGKLIDKIDKAMAVHFGNPAELSEEDDQHIRDALLYLDVQHASRNSDQLQSIYDRTIKGISSSKELNFTIGVSKRSATSPLSSKEFRSFHFPDALIVGHHHDPRDEPHVHDTGGFVGKHKTWLAIKPDGSIVRP